MRQTYGVRDFTLLKAALLVVLIGAGHAASWQAVDATTRAEANGAWFAFWCRGEDRAA